MVTKEVQCALNLPQEREGSYKVIPLLLDGITPNALHHWFPKCLMGIPIEIGPDGLDKAMPSILAAFGNHLPTQIPPAEIKPQVQVAELTLELTDPTIPAEEGIRRAIANTTLLYHPAGARIREDVSSISNPSTSCHIRQPSAERVLSYSEHLATLPYSLAN